MSDTPPDRLSVNPSSPYFTRELLERGVGIKFKGVERRVRVALGKKTDRKGNPLTIKLVGPVEAWFQSGGEAAAEDAKNEDGAEA
jgi:hypothetical protein